MVVVFLDRAEVNFVSDMKCCGHQEPVAISVADFMSISFPPLR